MDRKTTSCVASAQRRRGANRHATCQKLAVRATSTIIGKHPGTHNMAKMMKLRLGVSDDPTALQPSLSDCLGAMLQQADALMAHVLQGLELGAGATGPQRVTAL